MEIQAIISGICSKYTMEFVNFKDNGCEIGARVKDISFVMYEC